MNFRDQEEDYQECQDSRLVTLETEICTRPALDLTTRCAWDQAEVASEVAVAVCIRLLTTLYSKGKVVRLVMIPWLLLVRDTIQSVLAMVRQT